MGKHGKHLIYKIVGPWTWKKMLGIFSTNAKITSPQPPDPFNSLLQEFLNHFGGKKVCWSFLANIEVESSTRNRFDKVSVAIPSTAESTKFGKSERNKVGPVGHRNRLIENPELRNVNLWYQEVAVIQLCLNHQNPCVLYLTVFFCMDHKHLCFNAKCILEMRRWHVLIQLHPETMRSKRDPKSGEIKPFFARSRPSFVVVLVLAFRLIKNSAHGTVVG